MGKFPNSVKSSKLIYFVLKWFPQEITFDVNNNDSLVTVISFFYLSSIVTVKNKVVKNNNLLHIY